MKLVRNVIMHVQNVMMQIHVLYAQKILTDIPQWLVIVMMDIMMKVLQFVLHVTLDVQHVKLMTFVLLVLEPE
jgi:hypothetical protein